MAWEISEALATLEKAMRFESEGREFYMKAADRTEDEAGKRMFISLAADEQEHYDKLSREHDALTKTGQWLRSSEVVRREPVRWQMPTVFSDKAATIGKAISPSADDVEALKFAIKVEKESYDTYSASRDKADSPDAKALFAFLAAEEKGHYTILESALEYLGDTASFFLVEERAINEG